MTESDKDQTRQKIAVALQYELGADAAPRVTAKWKGDVAEGIVEVAEAAGVHIEHNEPLAQSASQLEGEPNDAAASPEPCHMGLQVSCGFHTEVPEESDLGKIKKNLGAVFTIWPGAGNAGFRRAI